MKIKELVSILIQLEQEREIFILTDDNGGDPWFKEIIINEATYENVKDWDNYDMGVKEGDYYVADWPFNPVNTATLANQLISHFERLIKENEKRLDMAIARSIYKHSERLVSMLPKCCFTCDDHNRCTKEQEGAEICESYTHTIIE